ncbi:MAG: leucyl/phenylalanyl-tRNA--protein transferase [Woeseiaceae bacterium]|nr:leucyl/phenylalanyl-tRNA--protein transferase [Woeseiaceae bacterium]
MSNSRVIWLSPTDAPDAFPDVELALREPNGLLAAGGDLGSPRLLAAYRSGIFPWYEKGQPILWWSPDPRCVLRPEELHMSRRLAKQIRNSSLTVRFNSAFAAVIRACAGPRRYQSGTWITDDMKAAYLALHDQGWAHSIEIWDAERLIGGLYGLCIGRVFFGESMFSAEPNASKMALAALARQMIDRQMALIDCQVVSPHLTTLGATLMPRARFTQVLRDACNPATPCSDWPSEPVAVTELLKDQVSASLH